MEKENFFVEVHFGSNIFFLYSLVNKKVMVGDGQVTLGSTVAKPNATKVRELREGIICGFAGATADCFALMDRLERKLDQYPQQLQRACVELAKDWRTDKYLRSLHATMIVADSSISLEITGNGDVMESSDGVISIGSGGVYALSAARALMRNTEFDAMEIATRSMLIAAELCIYTNSNFVIKSLPNKQITKQN